MAKHILEGVALMDTASASLDLLMELETRHEELLLRLDELDKRVEKTLAECQCLRSRSDQDSLTLKAG
jgi:hypothetical protein